MLKTEQDPGLPSPSLVCLPQWQASESESRGVEAKNMTLLKELADREDGRLMSQNHHLTWVWMSGSLMDQRWGEVRKQRKNTIYLANIS